MHETQARKKKQKRKRNEKQAANANRSVEKNAQGKTAAKMATPTGRQEFSTNFCCVFLIFLLAFCSFLF